MAPEQARGMRELTPAADLFALGCVLYECLAGQPPFVADHLAAVLVRILFEEPVPLEQRCPELPPLLCNLIGRMLRKDPAQRLMDATALRGLRMAVGTLPETAFSPTLCGPAALWSPFSDKEQGLLTVVLAAPAEPLSELGLTQTSIDSAPTGRARESLLEELYSLGGAAEFLASGALVVTMPQLASATDQATRAARAALAVKKHWPAAMVSLSTGRGRIQGRSAVGEVVDQAARVLRRHQGHGAATPAPWAVLADELSAKLLEGRFAQTPQPGGAMLLGEEKEADAGRPLLGKPTPCVGREAELGMLEVQLTESMEDSVARVVLVTAAPGAGKSRLRHEFLRRVEQRQPPVTILLGRGDDRTAGVPYGILGQALRTLCGLSGAEPLPVQRTQLLARLGAALAPSEREQVVGCLGELCNLPAADSSHLPEPPRREPRMMQEAIRRSFTAWLRAECEKTVAVIVLDDLQWADTLTVGLLDSALRELDNVPLFVLGLARLEVTERFPKLWSTHQPQKLMLRPLRHKACERLIHHVLGKQVPAEVVARLVEQSAGNALFLEELIRSHATGDPDRQPETVMAMLQARLARFEPGPGKLVRAASVLGHTFWRGGVMALLGISAESPDHIEVDKWLAELVDAELIESHADSCLEQEQEYGFRHALMREAAYHLLTDNARKGAHLLAARYLEHKGNPDPLALAEHYRRSGELEKAVSLYLRAAADASRMCAMTEARQHYAAAHDLVGKLPDDVENRRRTVEILLYQVQLGLLSDHPQQNLTRLSAARSLLADLQQAGQTGPDEQRRSIWVEILYGRLSYYSGHYVEANGYYARVLPMAKKIGNQRLQAILWQSLGASLVAQGQAGQAVSWLANAVAHQEHLENDFERMRAASAYGIVLTLNGRYQEGMKLLQQTVSQAHKLQQSAGLTLAYANLGFAQRMCGDFAALRETSETVLAQTQRSMEQLMVASTLSMLGWACSFAGQHQEAQSYRARAQQQILELGVHAFLGDWYAAADAEIALRAGDFARAITLAEELTPTFRKERQFLALGLIEQVWGLAIGHRDPQAKDAADAHLTAALQVMDSTEQRFLAAIARIEWAKLCRRRGDNDRAAMLHTLGVAQFAAAGCLHLVEGIERACLIK